MPKLLKISIIGCGAIGSSLAKIIASGFYLKAQLASLYDIDVEKAYNLGNKLNNRKLAALNLDDSINKSALVIEATKIDAAFDIAKRVLSFKRDIMIMSVGGIVEHYKELAALAEKNDAYIFIPSGAICGIDGLKASVCGNIIKITLTTKKPVRAFLGVPYVLRRKIRLDKIKEDTVIFEGSAISAIRAFPQNINVAATLSMAGLGIEKTLVRIVASPNISQNIHEIAIESDAGSIFTRCENVIHPDNPKTSYLAILSALATIREILEPIRIGT